jgi:Kelch motif
MAGTWQGLVNQPNFNTSTMILLTDGRVMVQEEAEKHWHALTPDSSGSYVNGTWSTLKDMSFWRRYYASGTLKDGRVILIGGEQSGDSPDTNKGEIYNPVSDTWGAIPTPPGWPTVGDAASCILPDGRLMIGALLTSNCIIYDPTTNSWAPAASKAVRSNEESWVLLPDNTIVTTQCWDPYQSEKYIISTNTWKNEGALPVRIVDLT